MLMRTSSRWRLALGIVAALLGRASGAQSPSAKPDAPVLPGCYRLTLGPWSKPSRLGPAQPTAVIRLDTIERRPGISRDLVAERIEPVESAPTGDRRVRRQLPASWRRLGADSVVIVAWSTGYEAEVFYGRWLRGSLQGVLRRSSDAIPVDPATGQIQWNVLPWATASAVLVPCQ